MAVNAQAGKFMFVEYAKPVESVKGQKKRRGGPSEVRAHITKNYHRALRVKRLETLKKGEVPTAGEPQILHRQDSSESHDDDIEEIEFAETELSIRPSPSTSNTSISPLTSNTTISPPTWTNSLLCTSAMPWPPSSENPWPPSSENQNQTHVPVSDGLPQSSSPYTLSNLLGSGRLDPFDVLPTRGMPLFVHQVLDHALVHSWPNTVPLSRSLTPTNPVKSSWLKLAMDHPVAFHAFLYATSFHILCAYGGREIHESAGLLRLSHKVETIKLVNEQLQGLSLGEKPKRKGGGSERVEKERRGSGVMTPTDALIMAVMILSIHSQRDEAIYPKVHAISPLARLNNLDIYGAMINDEKHIQGIILLVNQAGGLDGIQLYGLADTLSLCDLYFASKYACKPTFAWRHPITSLVIDGKHVLDPFAIDLSSDLGAGFRYLRHTSGGPQLLDVLDAYSEITVALDHHVRGGPTAPELVDLMEVRNCTQHRLLSQLPNPLDLSDPGLCVHHAVRLATLIFSEMVILPLPPPQGVKPRLALMLRQTLEACHLLRCWELHNQVLLWALTLGAIAASFTAQRSWYIDQLLHETSLMQVENWFALEATCSRFLWWKPICSEPLRWVWNEMISPIDET